MNPSQPQNPAQAAGLFGKAGRFRSWVICALLACLMTHLVWSAVVHSPTFDEPAFLVAGLSHWQTGAFDLYSVNPPLVRTVATAPVAAFMETVTDWSHVRQRPGRRPEFTLGQDFMARNVNAGRSPFLVARLTCLIFPVLLCGVCWHWSSRLFGPDAGTLAVVLCCFSPMIIGHGSLITPDVGAAAGAAIAVYQLRDWLRNPTPGRAIALGALTGIALLTKFTLAVVLPAACLLAWPLWRGRAICQRQPLLRDMEQLSVAAVVAVLVVNAGYLFQDSLIRLDQIPFVSRSLKPASESTEPPAANRFAGTVVGAVPVPVPALYLQGIDVQKMVFEKPAIYGPSYLMGEWKEGGWWHYYIIAILVKEPLALLALLLMAVWAASRITGVPVDGPGQAGPGPSGRVIGWREQMLLLLPAALVFLLISSQTGFNRHLRYVLPAYPFAIIFASQVACPAAALPWLRWLIRGLLVWLVVSTSVQAPDAMSYFNEAAGGSRHGSRWLLSSNVDWGQDYYRLLEWQEAHPEVTELHLAAYSSYDPAVLGIRYTMPAPFDSGFPEHTDAQGNRGPQPGWHAVSVNILKGDRKSVWNGLGRRPPYFHNFRYFEHFTPVDRCGDSLVIYRITPEDADRVRRDLIAKEREAFPELSSEKSSAEARP